MVLVGSGSGAGRITHEKQRLQADEAAEGPSRDARQLVVVLLRDGRNERSEASVDVACGVAERDDAWRYVEARAAWGASRTRYSVCRLVHPVSAPEGMAVSPCALCG